MTQNMVRVGKGAGRLSKQAAIFVSSIGNNRGGSSVLAEKFF
jgi:hypothetical protein